MPLRAKNENHRDRARRLYRPARLSVAGVEGLKDLPGYHTVKAKVHKGDASKE
jgi:hypothetical protein